MKNSFKTEKRDTERKKLGLRGADECVVGIYGVTARKKLAQQKKNTRQTKRDHRCFFTAAVLLFYQDLA